MADAWGIEHSYELADEGERHVSKETITELREILGDPGAPQGPIVAEVGATGELGAGEVVLEDGTSVDLRGARRGSFPSGYHQLVDPKGRARRLIVTPRRCHLPVDLRAWGWVSQLYATRSRASWGIGDLSDLGRLAKWSRSRGAGFVLISPIAAVAPTARQEPNPYFPASRRFGSPLYLSVGHIPGAERAAEELQAADRAGRALNESREIDHDAVWAIKRPALEAIWQSSPPLVEFERWLQDQPESLSRFAIWSVLAERHGTSWRDWPADSRRPDGDGVARVAGRDQARIKFYAWLQWCLERQLADAGRDVAIFQDLPIGFDPDGFDAWEWQDLLAKGASVGAPPDSFNRQGQDWGSPPFVPWRLRAADYRPFIETIRANLATGGGLRIDHVMGLFRLWCIPSGASPEEGAYVRYPAEDLLAILALESQRAGAVVVGEDLGTVEEGVRDSLSDHDLLSYRLLWFEREPPSEWPTKAMAAVTTHDLPTVAGLWGGSDLDLQRRLGLKVDEDGTEEIRTRLSGASGLSDDAAAGEAVVAAYRELSRAPCRLIAATLEDAVSETERPNMPGASERRLNWRLALPVPLEELESHPLANRVSTILDETREKLRKDSDA